MVHLGDNYFKVVNISVRETVKKLNQGKGCYF